MQAETENVVESAAPEEVADTEVTTVQTSELESTPPPDEKPSEETAESEVDASKKYDLEKADQPTTPEEVKQLNHVLDAEQNEEENHKPAEPPVAAPTEPAPKEPAPKENDSNSNPFPSMDIARQKSIPKRNQIKANSQENWAEKYKKFQNM